MRHCEERRRQPTTPIPGVFQSSHPPALEMWLCAGRDRGGSVASGSLTSPAAQRVHLLSHTAQGTRPPLPQALSKAPSRPRHPMVLVTNVKCQV